MSWWVLGCLVSISVGVFFGCCLSNVFVFPFWKQVVRALALLGFLCVCSHELCWVELKQQDKWRSVLTVLSCSKLSYRGKAQRWRWRSREDFVSTGWGHAVQHGYGPTERDSEELPHLHPPAHREGEERQRWWEHSIGVRALLLWEYSVGSSWLWNHCSCENTVLGVHGCESTVPLRVQCWEFMGVKALILWEYSVGVKALFLWKYSTGSSWVWKHCSFKSTILGVHGCESVAQQREGGQEMSHWV